MAPFHFQEFIPMPRFPRQLLGGLFAAAALAAAPVAFAQEVVKIGFVGELSGPFAEFGRQMQTGIRTYQKQFGETVAGKKIEVIYKDTGGANPELARRLAQELVLRDKVRFLAGFGFTPNAAAVAPVAAEAKVPMIVMNAAAGGLTARSPYMTRVSFSFPDVVPPIADWAVRQGYKKAYVLVADYAPGHDVEAAFLAAYKSAGGSVVGSVRVPMDAVEFAPYLQRVKDAKPDVLFAYVNGGDVSPALIKEYRQRGLAEAGIKLIGTGDITSEEGLKVMGDAALDTVTVYPYSATHKSDLNARFVRDFVQISGRDEQPTIMGVSGYDGMAAIYAALAKTGGKLDGEALMEAMKGAQLDSPRGPIKIDAATRDVVQNEYIRRVRRLDGALQNAEFETFKPAAAH
jgi:branched-chain amino acid transport system substrate-binding protein